MWAVCGFALTGDMKADSNEKVQRTETHYRARLEGSAIFHHRWVFECVIHTTSLATALFVSHNRHHCLTSTILFHLSVPPAYQARFAFPELKIQATSHFLAIIVPSSQMQLFWQLRSQKKEDEREKKAQDEWDAASVIPTFAMIFVSMLFVQPDVRKTLPDLSNGGKLPQLDSATALAEGGNALLLTTHTQKVFECHCRYSGAARSFHGSRHELQGSRSLSLCVWGILMMMRNMAV